MAEPSFLSDIRLVLKYGWRIGKPRGVTHSTDCCRNREMMSEHNTNQSYNDKDTTMKQSILQW